MVPESPRWLLCKGKMAEVKEVLQKAAKFNGRELPENLDKYLKPPCNEESESGVSELFRTKYLRLVTFCFLCIWFTMVSITEDAPIYGDLCFTLIFFLLLFFVLFRISSTMVLC